MPAKNKKSSLLNQSIHQDLQEQNFSDLQSPQKITQDKGNPLQISVVEAEQYFQYLRKKITNQNNDPFSLPFLNLKFQQLQSWKGATQQLNLQSRIYGLRVDSCHDYTIKMLNQVIRNQQQQIGRENQHLSMQGQEQIKTRNQSKQQANFHLQKPQKLIANVQIDKNIQNRSVWKVIFKKSQNISQIQMNTLQIGNNLALIIDDKIACNKANIQSKTKIQSQTLQEMINIDFQKVFYKNQGIQIFNQIYQYNKQLEAELKQIHQRFRNRDQQESKQNYRFGDGYGINEDIFLQFGQEFDYNKKDKYDCFGQQQDGQFIEQTRQDIIVPYQQQLFTIPIQNTAQLDLQNNFNYEQDQWQDQQQENLYEPQSDLLFSCNKKKNKWKKYQHNRSYNRKRKDLSYKVNFDLNVVLNREKVLSKDEEKRNMNNNLMPINYTVVYQSRNPFRKIKKAEFNTINTLNQRQSLYVSIQNSDQNILNQLTQFNSVGIYNTNNQNYLQQPAQNITTKKQIFYRNTSIKAVKSQIKNQLLNDQTFLNSKMLQNPHLSQSLMQNSIRDPQFHVGLKFLKHKMKNYDPLDILVSMLHIAYEQQVNLTPIYESSGEIAQNIFKLNDIVIRGEDCFMF